MFLHDPADCLQNDLRIHAFPLRIRIREPVPQITEPQRTEYRFCHCMGQCVRITVTEQPLLPGYLDTADHKSAPFHQTMNIR